MMTPQSQPAVQDTTTQGTSSEHDFDFLIGSWKVQHRKLVHRFANDDTWQVFSGTCVMQPLLSRHANVDENVMDVPGAPYKAIALRSFDPNKRTWSIWWLDGRNPGHLDVPVVGSFHNGVGTFFANDTFEGRPIVIRFRWFDISENSAKWQQAFSEDDGETWETNWFMEFHRAQQ